MRPTTILVAALAAGCGAPTAGAFASLQAEVQRLRAEQERQGRDLEVLRNRVVLTEDTARQARNALESAGRRRVISLGAEPTPVEPINVDATGSGDEPPPTPEPAPGGGESAGPRIRITGSDRVPTRPPFVVHDNERLPVAPVPPLPPPGAAPPAPAPGPRRDGRNQREAAPEPTARLDARAAPAYEAALEAARGGRCGEAVPAFDAFLVRWPDHPYAVNAMYWRGECFLHGGDARRAATEFEGLIARFPAGAKVPDALYKLAVCYRRLGDTAAAERAARRLMDEYPDSPAARRARGERQ